MTIKRAHWPEIMTGALEGLKHIPRLCENVCTPAEIFTEKFGPNGIRGMVGR